VSCVSASPRESILLVVLRVSVAPREAYSGVDSLLLASFAAWRDVVFSSFCWNHIYKHRLRPFDRLRPRPAP